MFVKSLETGRFSNIKVALFEISKSDSLGVTSDKFKQKHMISFDSLKCKNFQFLRLFMFSG